MRGICCSNGYGCEEGSGKEFVMPSPSAGGVI